MGGDGGDGGVNTVPSDLIFQHDFLMFWNFIQKVLVLLEGRYRYLPGEGGSSCPFRKRWQPFLRHLENFRPFTENVSVIAKQVRTWTFRMIMSLPYHYTSTPTCQNSEKFEYILLTNCFSKMIRQ